MFNPAQMALEPYRKMGQVLFGAQQPQAAPGAAPQTQANDPMEGLMKMLQDRNMLVRHEMNPRLTAGGQMEDPMAPHGVDWVKAHGDGVHSWDRPLNGADYERAGQAARNTLNAGWHNPTPGANKSGEHYTPFGRVAVNNLQPGEQPQPFTVEGQEGNTWLKQHALSNNPNELQHVQNLDPTQLNLFAQESGYNVPKGAQAPFSLGRVQPKDKDLPSYSPFSGQKHPSQSALELPTKSATTTKPSATAPAAPAATPSATAPAAPAATPSAVAPPPPAPHSPVYRMSQNMNKTTEMLLKYLFGWQPDLQGRFDEGWKKMHLW